MERVEAIETEKRFTFLLRNPCGYQKRLILLNLFSLIFFGLCFILSGGFDGNYIGYLFIIPFLIVYSYNKERALFYILELKMNDSGIHVKYMFKNQIKEIDAYWNSLNISKEEIKAKYKGYYKLVIRIDKHETIQQYKVCDWDYAMMDKICSFAKNKKT